MRPINDRAMPSVLGRWFLWVWISLALHLSPSHAQELSANRIGVDPTYNRFELEYLEPQVHKWYEPRHLPETYWQPWYNADNDYARQSYSRYVDRLLEGDDFYDVFGASIGRGWMVYSWTQAQPESRGSQIFKRPQFDARNSSEPRAASVNAYERFFDRLVIASDERGSAAYRLMVGDAIYTRFTPLTFSKPQYNGLRLDIAGARHSATLLLSRPSDPNGPYTNDVGLINSGNGTHSTHLLAGHTDLALGDWARLGLSYVNTHNAHTQRQLNNGNPFNGSLTILQNQSLRKLWVRLRDDSPADLKSGAVLLAYDIVLTDTSGREWRGSEIGFLPTVEGGSSRAGALVADGAERILIEYDLQALDYEGVRTGALRSAQIELDLANDYRIETSSNLQTDGIGSSANAVFLPQTRSTGNVQDRSNTGLINVDYGLPIASETYGVDWNMPAWRGLSLLGEIALNRRLWRYPNPALKRHHQIAETAAAMYGQASYLRYPNQISIELFSMDDDYSSNYWLTTPNGLIFYESDIPQVYELVDDDDDFNAVPEWLRPYQPSTGEVAWPGYDENGDFLNDHNQNANLIPDYEEPFLRFRSDRPEFLAGLDMNHNGTIDRFENDELPDYPYKRDHRGFNAYFKSHAGPDAALTLGRQDMRLVAGDGRTRAWYALGTWVRSIAGGRLRFFEYAALTKDNIADDLVQWVQPVDAQGRMREKDDELPAQNTWEEVFYADLSQQLGPGLQMQHRLKWAVLRQRAPRDVLRMREARRTSDFTGLINRVQWSLPFGLATLQPRFKSEYRHERPYSTRRPVFSTIEEMFTLLWTQPLLAEQVGVSYYPRYGRQSFKTTLELGLETSRLWLIEGQTEETEQDFWRWTLIVQLRNGVAYEGYQLITRAGLRLSGWQFADGRDQRSNAIFMTINAGLQ
mgnify:CR=1 FL=1|jgi:hypothetical protein